MPGTALAASSVDARTSKLSFRVAIEIEDDLLHAGWSEDLLVGSQAAIQERFGIGRWAFRETAKVLEMRGSARLKRGPRGGLRALAPELENFTRQIAVYMMLSRLNASALQEAAIAIEEIDCLPESSAIRQFLLTLFKRVVTQVGGEAPLQRRMGMSRLVSMVSPAGSLNELCYARQLALRIIEDFIIAVDSAHPRYLSSEWDLATRYGYSLEVVRQASRLLEVMKLVEVRIGRQGGIYSRKPKLVLSQAQLCSYLSSRGASPLEARVCAARLRTVMMRQASEEQRQVLDAVLQGIEQFASWRMPRPAVTSTLLPATARRDAFASLPY